MRQVPSLLAVEGQIQPVNRWEANVLSASTRHRMADFSDSNEPIELRAKFLQAILLGRAKLSQFRRRHEAAEPGAPRPVWITGSPHRRVIIRGPLNLEWLGKSDAVIPSIRLHHCDISEGISGAGAHIASLELRDCVVGAGCSADATAGLLAFPSATIHGPIELTELRSGHPEGLLELDLSSARVHGQVAMHHCVFKAQTSTAAERPIYAVDLHSCDIEGGLSVGLRLVRGEPSPACIFDGGLSVRSARIAGDVHVGGSQMTPPRLKQPNGDIGFHPITRTLNCQSARIGGNFFFVPHQLEDLPPARTRIHGQVWLHGAHLGGAVVIRSTELSAGSDREAALVACEARLGSIFIGERQALCSNSAGIAGALDFRSSRIEGEVTIYLGSESNSTVRLSNATIQRGAVICGDFVGRIEGTGLRVGQDLDFDRLKLRRPGGELPGATPGIALERARIGGELRLCDAQIESLHSRDGAPPGVAVDLSDIEVEKNVRLKGGAFDADVSLRSARIGGRIDCAERTTQPGWDRGAAAAFKSIDAQSKACTINGQLNLQSVNVEEGVDLNVNARRFVASSINIGENFALSGRICGDIWLNEMVVRGSLDISELQAGLERFISGPTERTQLVLSGSTIEGELKIAPDVARQETEHTNSDLFDSWPADSQPSRSARYQSAQFPWWGSKVSLIQARFAGVPKDSLRAADPREKVVGWYFLFRIEEENGSTTLMRGNSVAIRSINERHKLQLTRDHLVPYLSFYCDHVWSSDGMFHLLCAIPDTIRDLKGDREGWQLEAYFLYFSKLYRVTFQVVRDGEVNMESDTEAERKDWKEVVKLSGKSATRLRHRALTQINCHGLVRWACVSEDRHLTWNGEWQDVPEPIRTSLQPIHERVLNVPVSDWTATVDVRLVSTRCTTLNDDYGDGWERFIGSAENASASSEPGIVDMRNFVYRYLHVDEANVHPERRVRWLSRQFKSLQDDEEVSVRYITQPYEQVIRIASESGDYQLESQVVAAKADLEVRIKSFRLAKQNNERRKSYQPFWARNKHVAELRARVISRFESAAIPRWLKGGGTAALSLLIACGAYLDGWYIAQLVVRSQWFSKLQDGHSIAYALDVLPWVLFAGVGILTFKINEPFFRRSIGWLFRTLFGYGLNAPRAILTVIVSILMGGLFVKYANESGWMIIDVVPVATMVSMPAGQSSSHQLMLLDTVPESTSTRASPPPVCGDEINAWVYAADVFLPLLDLHEEERCEFREDRRFLRFLKPMYAVGGWVLVAMMILTVTGALRRQLRRDIAN